MLGRKQEFWQLLNIFHDFALLQVLASLNEM
jgi:hypothetical protein